MISSEEPLTTESVEELKKTMPDLAFGDEVRHILDGRRGIVNEVRRRSGKWELSLMVAGTGAVTHFQNPGHWQRTRRPLRSIDGLEIAERTKRWAVADDLTPERILGRVEGQLQVIETYLYRLTGMGLSRDRIHEMLSNDLASHDKLVEFARGEVSGHGE